MMMEDVESWPLIVLVVDDGRDNRAFVVDYILKPNGYFPLVARDGIEGMDAVRRYRPDLILLDLQMPRMDGLQMLDALQEEGFDIPVILMTFHGSEEIAVEVYRKGVRDYVKKPYAVDEMLAAMDRCLSEVRLRKDKDALTQRLLAANSELNRRVREFNLLFQIGKSVTALGSLDALMTRITDAAAQISGAEQVSLLVIEGDRMVCRAMKRLGAARAEVMRRNSTDPIALHVVKTGRAVSLSVEALASRRSHNPELPRAAVGVPLHRENRVVGVLLAEAITERAGSFASHEAAMLSALADYGAIALENARMAADLEKAASARRDDQRRGVIGGISDGIDRSMARRGMVGVLAGGLHGLDQFGAHASADEVVHLLTRLRVAIRETAGDWGGIVADELGGRFVVVFDGDGYVEECAGRAVGASVALSQTIMGWPAPWGEGLLQLGMGVHLGEAITVVTGEETGTMTGAMDFVAAGEAIETARRVQAHALAGEILVTEGVRGAVGARLQCDPVGALTLEGRAEPLEAFRVLGLS